MDCNLYASGGTVLRNKGVRCRGSRQQCAYPWFYYSDLSLITDSRLKQWPEQCEDNSEKVFYLNSNCPEGKIYLQLHHDFSTERMEEDWMENREDQGRYRDPHGCWDSCAKPGPGCRACTNESYFHCDLSGLCIHPDLRCDGHPQCHFAEDEAMDICFEKWVASKLVSQFASKKCSSAKYPGTEILSIPCDGIVECSDFSDEEQCLTFGFITTYILIAICTVIVIIYLAWKFSSKKGNRVSYRKSWNPRRLLSKRAFSTDNTISDLLEKYKNHHDDPVVIEEVNSYMLLCQFTEKIKVRKETSLAFYNNEVKIHQNDESAIFICMHQKLDPAISHMVYHATFPGRA